jgi:hypothetical protein
VLRPGRRYGLTVDVRASSVTDFRHDSRYDHSRVGGGVSHLRRGVNGIAHVVRTESEVSPLVRRTADAVAAGVASTGSSA